MLARTAFCAVLVCCVMARSAAQGGVEPGKSLWGVSLGIPHSQAVHSLGGRLAVLHFKRQPGRTLRGGITEDVWDRTVGSKSESFEVLSQNRRVVQLRAWTSEEHGQTRLSFADLLHRRPLRKSVFLFNDPLGGGYVGFYYDDLQGGVCYTQGTQDDFLLTDHPDGIIVHRPGTPVLPIEGGVRGKRQTGAATHAFANEAEARRAEQREQSPR